MAVKDKKKSSRSVSFGVVNVKLTFNNTIVTVADGNGNVIAFSSSGLMGFKGAKKATPYVAEQVVNNAITKAKTMGLKTIGVVVTGVSIALDAVLRSFLNKDLILVYIRDETPIAHNGCRKPKPRCV